MPNIKKLIAEKAKSLDGEEKKFVSFLERTDFDIVSSGSYCWTINTLPDFIYQEIPYIHLTEYRQNVSQFLNSLYYRAGTSIEAFKNSVQSTDGILKDVSNGNTDNITKLVGATENQTGTSVFGDLYVGNATGNDYRFPFLTEELYSAANEWSDASDSDNVVANIIKDGFKTVTEAFNAASKVFSTSSFTETVKTYKPSAEGNKIKFKFTLYNTKDIENVKNHYEFVVNFMKLNKHIRTNRTNVLPPVYYKMDIPGVRYSPACYVSNLSIRNEGKTRILDGRIIPDAYNIDIELTDLVSDCANLIGTLNESQMNQVNVIQSRDKFLESGGIKEIPVNKPDYSATPRLMRLGF
jgi:hypothetical protein